MSLDISIATTHTERSDARSVCDRVASNEGGTMGVTVRSAEREPMVRDSVEGADDRAADFIIGHEASTLAGFGSIDILVRDTVGGQDEGDEPDTVGGEDEGDEPDTVGGEDEEES